MIQAILFILLITVGIGLPLTLVIAPRHNAIGRIGLSYLLGIGLFTLVMFVTNIMGLKFNLLHTILIFITMSLPLILLSFKQLKEYCKNVENRRKNFRLDKLEKITLAGLFFFMVSNFVNTLYWPVYIWDSLTLYDFRAKLFTGVGTIKDSIALLGDNWNGYYLGYPLLTSLSHSVVYILGGDNPQFIYSLFYLSLGLVFYGQLREFASRRSSLLFTLMLLTIPQIFNMSIVAYTNLPYMTYFSLGALYFYIWDKDGKKGYLILSALLVGMSTWVRSTEPFWLVILGLVILFAIIRKRYKDILVFPIFFFPIRQAWESFGLSSISFGSTVGQVTGATSVLVNYFSVQKLQDIINFLYKGVILVWGPVFILFLGAVIYSLTTRRIKSIYMIYLITFTILAMLLAGTYVFSFAFPQWSEIPDSASRMAMIFYPLFIYSTALVASRMNANI